VHGITHTRIYIYKREEQISLSRGGQIIRKTRSMAEFSSIGLALILGLVLALFLLRFFSRQNHKNLPNGSMGFPFVGETLSLLKPHSSNSMGTFLQERVSR